MKPLHTDSYHHKGYWVKQELYGKGWKVRGAHISAPGFALEVIPQNSNTLDIKRFVKEWINLFLSQSDKSEV